MSSLEVPEPTVPPGLPDPAVLARLANAFFSARPGPASPAYGAAPTGDVPVHAPVQTPAQTPAVGGVPVGAHPLPPGTTVPAGAGLPSTPASWRPEGPPPGVGLVPRTPQSVADIGAQAPALLPQAPAQNGAPDHLVQAAPAYDGRLGSHVQTVPEAIAVPQASVAPGLPPPQALRQGGVPVGVPTAGWADPAAAARPGAATAFTPAAASPPATGAGPSYYFLSSATRTPAGPPGTVAPLHAAAGTPSHAAPVAPAFDVHAVRRDFPILQERVNGRPLAWFDNAATTQKPQAVIDRLAYFYAHENSNIHRAAHTLAARATDAYEDARETVRRFIGAGSTDEVVFVRGATEAINLVAKTWGAANVGAGDHIIVSELEHHANIVPWQQLAAEKGATLRVIPVDDSGQIRLDELRRLLSDRTRIVSVTQVSNALGTVVPVREVIALAHAAGARVLVDGAQSVSHLRVDVRSLNADFFVFSGHKVFGPTGIGVVYGKRELLEAMPPWQGGGNMIADVTFDRTVYHGPPTRFEAGTGNIADAVGLAAALRYVERIGIETIAQVEHGLLEHATRLLAPLPGVRLIGTARDKASVLSFVLDGHTTEEVGRALDREGIAVRTGHHCAQPILRRFGVEATVRPSFAFYNTAEEIERFIAVVRRLAGARPGLASRA